MKLRHNSNTYVRPIAVFAVLVSLAFILSGCNGVTSGNTPYNKKYYTGYDSLQMRFLPESPPNTFYYDQKGFNEIPIIVEVKNTGAADSMGGLYVHGIDPNMIQLAGGKLPGSSNVNFYAGNDGVRFSVGGIYVGLSGGGNAASVGGHFTSPDGSNYGFGVFTQDGQIKGLDIRMTPDRRGYGMSSTTLRLLSQYPGWNGAISLYGDTETTPGGGLQIYDFPAYMYAYTLPESLERFTQNIGVTACFDYATRASEMVCLDPNPHSGATKSCSPRTVTLSGGQGAPVAITRIDQQTSASKVVFTIYIKHNKKDIYDQLYDFEKLDKCSPQANAIVRPTDKNVVYTGHIRVSNQDITMNCIPDRRIRLDDQGNGQITCTYYFDGSLTSATLTPIDMELWYGYSKTIYKSMLVKKI
jgi:hypothetical protein